MGKKKMRKRPNNKMRTPEDNKAAAEQLEALRAEADAALHLLESEEADAIIGEQTPEFRQLIRGANALMGLSVAAMRSHGLRENAMTLKTEAQTLLMVAQLIHRAYALGIQRERESPTVGD